MSDFKYKFDFNREIPKRNKTYDKVSSLLKFIMKKCVYNGIKVSGLENIPKTGGYLIASNHYSGWDPFALATVFYPEQLHFMAKAEFFDKFYIRIPLMAFNGFPIDRESLDLGSINYSKRIIQNGHPLLIFPQATRQKNEDAPEGFKAGASLIIRSAKADVLPVAIKHKKENSKRATPYISIGKLIKYDEFDLKKGAKSKDLHNVSLKIEKAVNDLWKKI